MRTSRKKPFLSEILNDEPIPIGKLAYFRERFRDRLYELVVEEFLKKEESGLTRAEVARRIGRRPEQITRWLGAPGNWTLETVSDLLLAISKAEPDIKLLNLDDQPIRNYVGQDFAPQSPQKEIAAQPKSATEANDPSSALVRSIREASRGPKPAGPSKRLTDAATLT